MDPGELIRQRRLANRLTQAQLALRAGSTQAAISRLERSEISPTFDTVHRLLAVMGEELVVSARRGVGGHHRARLHKLRARPAAERLELAIGWNQLAGEVSRAGELAQSTPVTRREIPLDAHAILRVLADHNIDYVLIGGMAVQAHGHPRTTQGMDVMPNPSSLNLTRLRAALTALHARPVGATRLDDDALDLSTDDVLELDTDAGGVDVHLTPPGAAPYAQVRDRALELDLGTPVAVAGRDDLIAMKRASGRPIDRGDILALTERKEPA